MVCAHCKMEIPDGASVCGHCRKSTGAKENKAGAIALAFFGIVIMVGWIGSSTSSPTQSDLRASPSPIAPAPKTPAECLLVSGVSAVVNEYSLKVKGTVSNNCGRDFRYVEINYKVTDTDGALLGRAMTNLSGLADGEKWKFEAISTKPGERYSFESIEAH